MSTSFRSRCFRCQSGRSRASEARLGADALGLSASLVGTCARSAITRSVGPPRHPLDTRRQSAFGTRGRGGLAEISDALVSYSFDLGFDNEVPQQLIVVSENRQRRAECGERGRTPEKVVSEPANARRYQDAPLVRDRPAAMCTPSNEQQACSIGRSRGPWSVFREHTVERCISRAIESSLARWRIRALELRLGNTSSDGALLSQVQETVCYVRLFQQLQVAYDYAASAQRRGVRSLRGGSRPPSRGSLKTVERARGRRRDFSHSPSRPSVAQRWHCRLTTDGQCE
jgi:hypothetical protein